MKIEVEQFKVTQNSEIKAVRSSDVFPLTVAKFGGTSMANAEAMLKAARIVSDNPSARLVVVSATSGTTNQLLDIFRATSEGRGGVETLIQSLESKHLKIAEDLGAKETVQNDLSNLILELQSGVETLQKSSTQQHDSILDQLLSLGERLSSILFAEALKKVGRSVCVFDVRKVLRTSSSFGKAEPLPEFISSLCRKELYPILQTHDVTVTQGFIGSDAQGHTTTLGRGGSDLSASLLAEGLEAQEVQIWTDVNGIYTIDPNLVSTAFRIESISFSEAAELANFGAKVLHPATLWPAVRKNIRVFIGSTFEPHGGGTWVHSALKESPLVRAIAVRKNQTLITVSSLRMLNAHGFLAKLFSILAKHEMSIDLVTTSEVSVALTVDGTSLGSSGKKITENKKLIEELEEIAQLKIEENLSLIAVIGNDLTSSSGMSAKAFQAISEFNIRLICHGASNHNFCFLVKAEEGTAIAKRLHHVFIDWPVSSPQQGSQQGKRTSV